MENGNSNQKPALTRVRDKLKQKENSMLLRHQKVDNPTFSSVPQQVASDKSFVSRTSVQSRKLTLADIRERRSYPG